MLESRNLEVHVVDHCNLDCVGCSHESPLMPRRFEDPETLATALCRLWEHYRAPLVKLLGGEPLLHPALADIIESVHAVTQARVRVVTNGVLLTRFSDRVVGADEVHVSVYPGVRVHDDDELRDLACRLQAPITLERFDRFRWHRAVKRHDSASADRVFRTCQLFHVWGCHTVREARFYPCPPAATWSDTDEFVDLTVDDDLGLRLENLLVRQSPLIACRECLGSVGEQFSHRRGWRSGTHAGVSGVIDVAMVRRLEANPDAWNDCYEYTRTVHPSGHIELHDETR